MVKDGLTVKATRLTDTVVAPILHEIGCDQETPSVATLRRIHVHENSCPVPFITGHGRAILLPQGADQRRKEAAVFSRGGITQYLSSTFRAADWLVFIGECMVTLLAFEEGNRGHLPQHFLYFFPEPHGQGSLGAGFFN